MQNRWDKGTTQFILPEKKNQINDQQPKGSSNKKS